MCPSKGLTLIVFQSVLQMVSDWYFSNSGGNSILTTCNFHMLFNSCYAACSNGAVAIQLKRKDGSVGSPLIEGTRLADQSLKHPFAQLNSLSLNFCFNSLAAGL
jgi:hypothetical protein